MTELVGRNILWSLNGKDVGLSYTKLLAANRWVSANTKLIGYFGPYGGRFTRKTSEFFINFLRQSIDNPERLPGFKNPGYSNDYAKYKRSVGAGLRPWYLTGKIRESIGILWRGRHTQTVGIRKGITTPRKNLAGKTYGTVKVAWYAGLLEFGSSQMDARPLFMPATVEFTRKYWPMAIKAVEKTMRMASAKWSQKNLTKPASSGDVGGVMGAATLNTIQSVASRNPSSDFKDRTNELLTSSQIGSRPDQPLSNLDSKKEMTADFMADEFMKSIGEDF